MQQVVHKGAMAIATDSIDLSTYYNDGVSTLHVTKSKYNGVYYVAIY